MVRTPSCDKSGLRKGTWTPEEDRKLIAYVTRYGSWNWRQLPKFAGLQRCGKSCRLRWINYLRPNVKRGNYTPEEEECIIRMHKQLGNRWSAIAAELPGRTDNEIKNHWHTTLKKRSQQNRGTNEELASSNALSVTLPVTSHISDNSSSDSLSPLSSCSEFSSITSHLSSAASMENYDLDFLDSYNESFWNELNLDEEISYDAEVPCETVLREDTIETFQSKLDAPKILDSSVVIDNDFGEFIDDSYADNFWTGPYVADMSHVPSELLVPSVVESEYFTPIFDDLWS